MKLSWVKFQSFKYPAAVSLGNSLQRRCYLRTHFISRWEHGKNVSWRPFAGQRKTSITTGRWRRHLPSISIGSNWTASLPPALTFILIFTTSTRKLSFFWQIINFSFQICNEITGPTTLKFIISVTVLWIVMCLQPVDSSLKALQIWYWHHFYWLKRLIAIW